MEERERIEVNIIAMSPSVDHEKRFVIVLEDDSRKRRIPILIGEAEAMSIGIALERLKVKRPLTHDLIVQIINQLNAHLQFVQIKEVKNNTFHSEIILINQNKERVSIDCRTSDALALAVREEVPIFIFTDIIEQQSLSEDIYSGESGRKLFSTYSLEQLEQLLEKVLAKEDYHSAIRIRESIERKKNQS